MGKQANRTLTQAARPADEPIRWSLMQKLLRGLDFLFILRPTLFFPVWVVYAAGFAVAQWRHQNVWSWTFWEGTDFWLLGLTLTLLMGSAFILNQIIDIPIDRQNRKLFLLADGHVPLYLAYFEAIMLFFVSTWLAFRVDLAVGALFLVIYFVTGVGYSLPPFCWKDRPVAGLLANMFGAMLIFAAGFWATGQADWLAAVHGVPYMAAVGAVFLFTTLPDKPGDSQFGKETFAVRFGDVATIYSGAVLEILALASAAALRDPVMFFPALVSAPFFVYAAWRPRTANVVRAIKFPILLLAFAVCFYYPILLLLFVGTYALAKWYYWQRFGLHYPSLKVDES